MKKRNDIWLRILISLTLIAGLLYLPLPAFSQEEPGLRNLIVNGDFSEGFQDAGLGFGWGAFSNGQATVGWGADEWSSVVPTGQQRIQMIEIKNARELNRYAGIYQTVPVVPGAQYKLTIKGLIRSTEGDIEVSDYGYRLQYGVDYNGGTAWELVPATAWHELPWDEQPLSDVTYRFETFAATLTAQSDHLTLFIRGWKKWIDNGSGIYDIQEISLVGPAPDSFAASPAQPAGVEAAPPSAAEPVVPDISPGQETVSAQAPSQPETKPQSQILEPANSPAHTEAQLPVAGQGRDGPNYVLLMGATLLLILFAGALTAATRRRKLPE